MVRHIDPGGGPQSVGYRPAAAAVPENLSEMQILDPTPDKLDQNSWGGAGRVFNEHNDSMIASVRTTALRTSSTSNPHIHGFISNVVPSPPLAFGLLHPRRTLGTALGP